VVGKSGEGASGGAFLVDGRENGGEGRPATRGWRPADNGPTAVGTCGTWEQGRKEGSGCMGHGRLAWAVGLGPARREP
jgi:hypothetical protein